MYAVIKTGGKQYKVSPGDVIVVEKLLGETGAKIKLNEVLIIGEEGKDPEVGLPMVSNAAVNCEVMDQSRADKVIVFKKKRRQGYKRKKGHRQDQTVLRVLDINGKGAVKKTTKKSTVAEDGGSKTEIKEKPKANKSKTPEVKVEAEPRTKDATVEPAAAKKDTDTKNKKPAPEKKVTAKKKAAGAKAEAGKKAPVKKKTGTKTTKEK
ncbi:MAG: 50S ribosomal protein L21 [Pseudomonadota bacterium]|nr:50S ribosomal protein L21 [Pseudomonadota bacterium]